MILDLIPAPYRLAAMAVAAAVLALGCFLAGNRVGAARVQQKWDRAQAAATEAALRQSEANREVEQLRRRAQQGVVDGVQKQNTELARRAADLDRVDGRVLDYADALAQRCSTGDTAAAASSPAAAGPGVVLANLYRSADREAVELARAYDAARIAGLGCEQSYDALTR